jgi:signal transduction histidine kinase/ActR/RegA family two-component response regulator
MRGIYNLKTLKFDGDATIIKKIFGTFLSVCIISSLFAATLILGILQQNLSYNDALFILKKISIIWCLILTVLLLSLLVLLKNSISPLINLITHSKNSTTLQKIEIPKNLSEEVHELYEIMNSTISRLKEFQTQTIESEKNAAIALTTQMLAHDVRKPFSLLRMALTALSSAKDPIQIQFILTNIIPEVDRAINKVNGMLADIMEIGSPSKNLCLEPTSPESLIELTITENFRTYNKTDIHLTYNFFHDHMINAHPLKLERVFSNILTNAIQAMNFKGNIWFQTKEILTEKIPYIEFCIGNNNSFIAEENLQNLFKVFFTRCKHNGTGLGLAIAEKVIKAHGGKIWCTSLKDEQFPKGKVEFWFTIPIAEENSKKTTAHLPSHSSEINKFESALTFENTQSFENKKIQIEASETENEIIELSKNIYRPIHFLIVDDEMIYRNILVEILSKIHKLNNVIKISQAEGSHQALSIIKNQQIDLILTDFDMGTHSLNGVELIKEIKNNQKITSLFCVHSNHFMINAHKTSFSNSTDIFIPKPITKDQLLKLILQGGMRYHLNQT